MPATALSRYCSFFLVGLVSFTRTAVFESERIRNIALTERIRYPQLIWCSFELTPVTKESIRPTCHYFGPSWAIKDVNAVALSVVRTEVDNTLAVAWRTLFDDAFQQNFSPPDFPFPVTSRVAHCLNLHFFGRNDCCDKNI